MSVTSTEDFGPETIADLLANEPSGTWTNADPDVFQWHEVSQQGKENNSSPALYVWSPIDISSERFSADGDTKIDQEVVEVHCWTLDFTETRQYAKDVSRILEQYLEDNYANTNWHFIDPETVNDARHEKIARRTDHFIAYVQVRMQDVRDTGP